MSYLQMLQEARRDTTSDTPSRATFPDRAEQMRPTESEVAQAMRLLNLGGVRIIRADADLQVGVWEDLDGPELRAAIHVVGLHVHPIVHLESAEVPIRYKVRSCPDRLATESFSSWVRRAEQAHRQHRHRANGEVNS